MKRRSKDKRSNAHLAIAGAFLVALLLSPLQGLFGFAQEDWQAENRRLASIPENQGAISLIVNHRSDLADYVTDHFGLRRTLVRWHHRAKLWLFGKSPVPRLIVGDGSWLYRGEHDPLDDLRAMTPLPEDLFETWHRSIRDVAEWLEERGIPLLVVIAPSKQTIYPEHLPEGVRSFDESSRVDEMLARFAEQGPLDVVDLRPAVRAAKQTQRTFDMTDTHWNDVGAHAGYVEIVNRLSEWFPKIRPKPLSDFRIEQTDELGGNLARMLAMKEVYREDRLTLSPLSPRLARKVNARPYQTPPTKTDRSREQDNSDLPRVVMFHDSFALKLIPLLAEHFSRLDCRMRLAVSGASWNLDEDREMIDTSQPDVVIWEIAERAFQRR